MFKLQFPSKYSPFDAIHLSRGFFSTAQNSFWTHRFWCLLVILPFLFFVSPLPHWRNVSLWGLFSSRETKESLLGWDQVNREGETWGSWCFWCKTAEHSASALWAGALVNHHEMGNHTERVFKKFSMRLNAASHHNASWYTDTDGFLEHSPSRGSLYYQQPHPPEDNSGVWGGPHYRFVCIFKNYT